MMNINLLKNTEEIEKALTSPGKLKILRLLMMSPNHTFTRYEIRKKLPLSPTDIKSDLNTLIQLDWIKEHKIQHLQKYSINIDKPIVKQFLEFFKTIRYI